MKKNNKTKNWTFRMTAEKFYKHIKCRASAMIFNNNIVGYIVRCIFYNNINLILQF